MKIKKICKWFLGIVIFVSFVLWLWKARICKFNETIDYDAFGSFGSFFGGFIGTIIVAATLIVAYDTYKDSQKNQIETRFFQLLQMVADTRNDLLKIDKDIFGIYIRYIGVFYKKIEELSSTTKNGKWLKEDMLIMAYLYFFYGIKDLDKSLYDGIDSISEDERKGITKELTNSGIIFDNPAFKTIGIYFRQLYQAVTYIDERKELDFDEKYRLIKTLRVTMNIEEQFLFFVNSLTKLGRVWEKGKKEDDKKNHLISKYNLIKNIPRGYEPIKGIDINFDFISDLYPNVDYEHLGKEKTKKKKKKRTKKNTRKRCKPKSKKWETKLCFSVKHKSE